MARVLEDLLEDFPKEKNWLRALVFSFYFQLFPGQSKGGIVERHLFFHFFRPFLLNINKPVWEKENPSCYFCVVTI